MGGEMVSYNFPNHKKGDTFNGIQFTINVNGSPLNLTGASIAMDLRLTPTGASVERFSTAVGEGITISTPKTAGIFTLDTQIIDIAAGDYYYDIQITLANSTIKTYIGGRWIIEQDITYT